MKINSSSNFGTGADGAVVISSDTTISSDINATSFTVDSGVTVTWESGVVVYCQGNFENNGTIRVVGKAYTPPTEGLLVELYSFGYRFPRVGAAGGLGPNGDGNGNAGANGVGFQCGGGGSGGSDLTAGGGVGGNGAPGSSLSGGSGGGGGSYDTTGTVDPVGRHDGEPGEINGGAGGNGATVAGGSGTGGGAGNPGGTGYIGVTPMYPGQTGTGGVFIAIVDGDITNNGTINANGFDGGPSSEGVYNTAGGGSGGGAVAGFYTGSYVNNGTVSADGGLGGVASGGVIGNFNGGDGGKGTINFIRVVDLPLSTRYSDMDLVLEGKPFNILSATSTKSMDFVLHGQPYWVNEDSVTPPTSRPKIQLFIIG